MALGNAIQLNGASEWFTIPSHADFTLNNTSVSTFSWWFNLNNVGSSTRAGMFGRTDQNWIHVCWNEWVANPGERMQLFLGNGSWIAGGHGQQGSKTSWNADEWYHAALRFDDTPKRYQLYINGVEDINYVNITSVSNPAAPIVIGNSNSLGATFSAFAAFDQWIFYRRLLKVSDIQDINNAGVGAYLNTGGVFPTSGDPIGPGLTTLLRINENAFNTAPGGADFEDDSGKAHHASMTTGGAIITGIVPLPPGGLPILKGGLVNQNDRLRLVL